MPTQSTPAVDGTTNRLLGYSYDAAGNVLASGHNALAYDAENRLVSYQGSASTAAYAYDGDGRRVMRSVRTALALPTMIYVQVYDAMGKMIAEYNKGAVTGSETNPKYITADHLGSTRLVTNADGSVKARYDYLPFGEELGAGIGTRNTTTMMYGGTDATRQKFTGHERDVESGLDFAQARYCASVTGRFMSPDPLLLSGRPKQPQSWNRYSYVLNNPLMLVDPDGLDWRRNDETKEIKWYKKGRIQRVQPH